MTQEQTEHLRHGCLQYLAERSMLAFNAAQVLRALKTYRVIDFSVSIDDVGPWGQRISK